MLRIDKTQHDEGRFEPGVLLRRVDGRVRIDGWHAAPVSRAGSAIQAEMRPLLLRRPLPKPLGPPSANTTS